MRILFDRFIVGLFFLAVSLAVNADSLDDALGGFDEESTPVTGTEIPVQTDSEKSPLLKGLTGSIALSSSYNFCDHTSTNGTDWQGLSKLRTRLNLEYNNAFSETWQARVGGYGYYDSVYSLRDRSRYSNEVLDGYEHESEFQEVWVRGKLRNDIDIKIGRQVVVWGRADSFRVLDILNPLDNREPGLGDIEDLRLPVTMIKTDYFFAEKWQSSFIIIPEVRFSKNAPNGSDYEPIGHHGELLNVGFKENKPENIADSSYAAAVSGIFSGWDISFHAASYWRDTPYLKPKFDVLNFANPLDGSTLEHSRLTLFGTGGNYTKGAWLFKGELAWIDGIDYTTSSPQTVVVAPGPVFATVDMPTDSNTTHRIDSLIGIEYFGVANSSFSIEVANQAISNFKSNMAIAYEEQSTTGIAFRATHSMMNDRLDLTAVVFGTFGESGGGQRFDAEYDIRDALVLKAGIIFYNQGNNIPFNSYGNNDRLFAELKYSF